MKRLTALEKERRRLLDKLTQVRQAIKAVKAIAKRYKARK